MERVRGTCVAVEGAGVLLRGRSGCGKSDLALRLIDGGARLVSDDYTCVEAHDGKLLARAPEELAGLLEVRGVGIVRMPAQPSAPVVAAVDLTVREAVERMPAPQVLDLEGMPLPLFCLYAFEASAVAKVHLVVRIATGGIMRLP
jgi:HPr kinase/phosphorylase